METVIHSDNDFATVAYLRIRNAVLIPKEETRTANPRLPPLLENRFSEILDRVTESSQSEESTPSSGGTTSTPSMSEFGTRSKQTGLWVAVGDVQRTTQGEMSVADEVRECFHILEGYYFLPVPIGDLISNDVDQLKKYSLNLSHCANINVFLSSIDSFAAVNQVYSSFFGSSPPARACVAVDLPPPIRIRFDCIAYVEKNPSDRQALHVQGLSYWAPANIGPYSQAITVRPLLKSSHPRSTC